MASVSFCLTYFTKHTILQIHPCCCKWQKFSFYGWVIFHLIYIYIYIKHIYILNIYIYKTYIHTHTYITHIYNTHIYNTHIYNIYVYTYTVCLLMEMNLFHILANVNGVMNIGVHVSFRISSFIFLQIYIQEWDWSIKSRERVRGICRITSIRYKHII